MLTDHARNAALRKQLHATHTTGVESSDMGVKAPTGFVWCVRCGQLLTKKRGLSHRQFRCWSSRAATFGPGNAVEVIDTDAPQGCQRIIVKRPRVIIPRPKSVPDPLKKLRLSRADAEAALLAWDRKLAIAMTKVRQYRTLVKRRTATLEAALESHRPAAPGKTRHIALEES